MAGDEEIAQVLHYLTLAQVYDALSYYHDHREEIDQVLERNRLSPEEATVRQTRFELVRAR